jgi:hypothetical protein
MVLVPGYHPQGHAAEIRGDLKSNPFEQPAPAEKVADKVQETAKALELRGIMIAGPRSQANIGGEIIAIGEEIDGYRLVSVKQRHVVLIRNDVKKILAVDADGQERRE